jgi:hypothetical protein
LQFNSKETGPLSSSRLPAGRASMVHSAHHGLGNHREASVAGEEEQEEGKVAVGDMRDIIAAAARAAVDAQRQAEQGENETCSSHVEGHGRGGSDLPCYAEESIQWEMQTTTSRRTRRTKVAHSIGEANSNVASPAMRPRDCAIGPMEQSPHGNGHASIPVGGISRAFGAAAPAQRNHEAVMSRLHQLETMLLSHAEATRASFEQLEKCLKQMQQERAPPAPAGAGDPSLPLRISTSLLPQSHFAHIQSSPPPPLEMCMEISDNAATSSALRARIRDSLSRAQLESHSTVPRVEHNC